MPETCAEPFIHTFLRQASSDKFPCQFPAASSSSAPASYSRMNSATFLTASSAERNDMPSSRLAFDPS